MNAELAAWGQLEKLTWQHVLLAICILAVARLSSDLVRGLLRLSAEKGPPRLRLTILRAVPISRLVIGAAALIAVVPIFVEPTFGNAVAVIASVGIALAFALKDYASSLIAGLLTIVENTYQPGD